MTALAHRRVRELPHSPAAPPNRVLLHGIDWQTYCRVADAFPNRPIRITYDRGDLEIMTVSALHERCKSLLNLIVVALAGALHRKVGSYGSFTHRREDLLRALEPDLCFYLQHFAAVRRKRQIDLEKDPPPDLAIEIDISRSSLNRMAIYAALGILEVWRLEDETLRIYTLVKGSYALGKQSAAFPEVPVAELVQFLAVGMEEGDYAMMEAVGKWARGSKKSKKAK
jgi:Uma2 family endonuclease